jgi:hypothetical protein
MTERTVCRSPLLISPGMRLARPVLRADGEVLLAIGTELDREQLQQLLKRHVDFVYVQQEETRDAGAIEEEAAAATARVERIFRGPGSESREELRAAVMTYRREEVV